MRNGATLKRQCLPGTVRLLIAASVFAIVEPALAQVGILKTRPSSSSTWNPLTPFTIGTGLEFETDSEQTQYDFPLVVEYNPTQLLQFTLESAVTHIDGNAEDVRTVTGLDDLETSVAYEFLRERRYTPALTGIGLIKWPLASDSDIGSPGTDYAIGLIASKDLVYFDMDLNLLYTFSDDPDQQDTLETSLAASYPLNYKIELETEILHSFGTDSWRGKTGPGGAARGGADETEITLGFAWHVNPFLTLEQGALFRVDGTWQLLFGLQYDFGGE